MGVVEAKKVDEPLTGVEIHSVKYCEGSLVVLADTCFQLSFAYEPTGVETCFRNSLGNLNWYGEGSCLMKFYKLRRTQPNVAE